MSIVIKLLHKKQKPRNYLSFYFTIYNCYSWTRQDLNPLPPQCKCGALPGELLALYSIYGNDYTKTFQ